MTVCVQSWWLGLLQSAGNVVKSLQWERFLSAGDMLRRSSSTYNMITRMLEQSYGCGRAALLQESELGLYADKCWFQNIPGRKLLYLYARAVRHFIKRTGLWVAVDSWRKQVKPLLMVWHTCMFQLQSRTVLIEAENAGSEGETYSGYARYRASFRNHAKGAQLQMLRLGKKAMPSIRKSIKLRYPMVANCRRWSADVVEKQRTTPPHSVSNASWGYGTPSPLTGFFS